MQAKLQMGRCIVHGHFLETLSHGRPPQPRKYPQQSRSKMLVMSIQQACVEVFEREPACMVTMSMIAQHAGVTKGSVYQYFYGIDSVIASIYDRVIERAFRRTWPAGLQKIEEAKLAAKLGDFDMLFARSYYKDFYRHALAFDRPLLLRRYYGQMESA